MVTSSSFDPSMSLLAGMPADQLRAALASAQKALIDLQLGVKEVTLSYTQGDGSRTVSFAKTDEAKLGALIRLLQAQLGMTPARRPVRFNF